MTPPNSCSLYLREEAPSATGLAAASGSHGISIRSASPPRHGVRAMKRSGIVALDSGTGSRWMRVEHCAFRTAVPGLLDFEIANPHCQNHDKTWPAIIL